MESSGYRQAVIHIAWFRDDQVRHLLFGMVELRPNEFPDADGCALHSHRTAPKSRRYLHYRRFAMSATDAIEWYKTATARRPITLPSDPNNPTRGDGASLTTGAFVQKPCWPQTLTSKKLVFAPDWMDSARANFLFRQDSLPADVSTILQVHRNRGRLADWLNFDIVDAYSDYQGAICLVAPNPVFRSIDRSHIGSSDTGTAESVAYKIVARQGQRLNGLRLEITNELAHGPLTPIVHKFDDNPITVFNFPTRIHKEGLSVVHPDQGLLYWRRPAPLVRSIHTTMGLIRRRKVVEVPAGGRRRPVERYEVNEVGDEIESVIGEAPHNPISRIAEAESRRARRQLAKDYDQEWFYQEPQKAAEYVRERIGSARETVFIVDPYFAGIELLAFGHATSRSAVHVRILSSTTGLKKSDPGEIAFEAGSHLQEICNTTFSDDSSKPEIRVLGDPPGVHDRFLVIDGNVWFSGNSLNRIGERAGMIVRLLYPEPVVARLEAFWSQAQTLSEWLANHTDREAVPADDGQAV
jgi:hypothetical protein